MCGILAVIGPRAQHYQKNLPGLLNHRGPDDNGIYADKYGVLYHDRLSIVDLKTGQQPIQGSKQAYLIHNGEIYNHQELRQTLLKGRSFRTQSDSEVILRLYETGTPEPLLELLDGIFAFVILDGDNCMAARDPFGVKPLYYGYAADKTLFFASEMKALAGLCKTFAEFPAGHYYTPQTGVVPYFQIQQLGNYFESPPNIEQELCNRLTAAVKKRLMADVPIGCLLSGGLDSSIIAAIMRRLRPKDELHTFSVGISYDAPDIKAAREVATFIGSQHHEVIFDINQAWKDLEQIVWHLESYDITNVRSGIPLYYLCRAIAQNGIKVVLSGEGADEIFGGYRFFHLAPSDQAFHQELVHKLQGLATIDCLRVDRMSMAHGLEVRIPFLDRAFVKWAMALPPSVKRPQNNPLEIEKYLLRRAFDDPQSPYLPQSILWRNKEQFSDGVGYNWREQFLALCSAEVPDLVMQGADKNFEVNVPKTKEGMYIRQMFDRLFSSPSAAKCSTLWQLPWINTFDPSGRESVTLGEL